MSLLDLRETFQSGHHRRERKLQRRRLRAQDVRSAKLAELHHIEALLVETTRVVERGWMQHGWFAYTDQMGTPRIVTGITPRTARDITREQVTRTCLIGAIVTAAGGPSEMRSQLVQRTIDLTWHASFRGQNERIRWCPSRAERVGHTIDLVRWNDRPERTADHVTALLGRARSLAHAEAEETRPSGTSVAP